MSLDDFPKKPYLDVDVTLRSDSGDYGYVPLKELINSRERIMKDADAHIVDSEYAQPIMSDHYYRAKWAVSGDLHHAATKVTETTDLRADRIFHRFAGDVESAHDVGLTIIQEDRFAGRAVAGAVMNLSTRNIVGFGAAYGDITYTTGEEVKDRLSFLKPKRTKVQKLLDDAEGTGREPNVNGVLLRGWISSPRSDVAELLYRGLLDEASTMPALKDKDAFAAAHASAASAVVLAQREVFGTEPVLTDAYGVAVDMRRDRVNRVLLAPLRRDVRVLRAS